MEGVVQCVNLPYQTIVIEFRVVSVRIQNAFTLSCLPYNRKMASLDYDE